MWFAYMDETGNTGRNLDDPDQPIHLIPTMAVEESGVRALHEHAEGHFAGRAPEERIRIYDAVLAGIEAAGGEIVVRGVSKPDLKECYANPFHPHDIALMFTIESIERLARERGCRFLLVADEAKEIEDAALRDLANYQEVGTSWGWKAEQPRQSGDFGRAGSSRSFGPTRSGSPLPGAGQKKKEPRRGDGALQVGADQGAEP